MNARRLVVSALVLLAWSACSRAQPRLQAPATGQPTPGSESGPDSGQATPASQQEQPRWSVSGTRNEFEPGWGSRLVVEDGGRQHVLIDPENNLPPGPLGQRDDLRVFDLLEILRVGDFDGDGRDDALVEVFALGNCCVPCYLFASVPAHGPPVVSRTFCTGEGRPVVEERAGKPTFTITADDGRKTYAFEGGEARLLSLQPHPKLEAVFEFTAERLWKLAEERGTSPDTTTERLEYDLDGNGRAERIDCAGSERWNGLRCTFFLGDRQVGELVGCKRVEVLRSMTQGMHDLACDGRLAARWNGSSYP